MKKINIATKILFFFCYLMLLSVFAMSESGAFFTNQAELLGVTISTGHWEEPSQPEPGSVVISEIMWMGTIGANPSDQPIPENHDRFIELFNTSEEDIDIGGWTIANARSGNNDLTIPENSVIKANSRFLITHREVEDSNFIAERDSVLTINLQQNYHANGQLLLRDAEQTTIDATPEIIDNPQDWPAGEGTTGPESYRASMMRTDLYSSGNNNDNWHTCNVDNLSDNEIDEMRDLWRKESRPYNCGFPGRESNLSVNIFSLPESEKRGQKIPETAGSSTPQKEEQSQEDLDLHQSLQSEEREGLATDPESDQKGNEEDDENNEDEKQKEEELGEQEGQNRQSQQKETDNGNDNPSSDESKPDEVNDENKQSEDDRKDKEEKNKDDNNESRKEDRDSGTGTSTNIDSATENQLQN